MARTLDPEAVGSFKVVLIPQAKWKKIEKFIDYMMNTGIDQLTEEWLPERKFVQLTGLNTKEKLRGFRKNHPDLWKSEKSYVVIRKEMPVTINRGFIYNYVGYKKMSITAYIPRKNEE